MASTDERRESPRAGHFSTDFDQRSWRKGNPIHFGEMSHQCGALFRPVRRRTGVLRQAIDFGDMDPALQPMGAAQQSGGSRIISEMLPKRYVMRRQPCSKLDIRVGDKNGPTFRRLAASETLNGWRPTASGCGMGMADLAEVMNIDDLNPRRCESGSAFERVVDSSADYRLQHPLIPYRV